MYIITGSSRGIGRAIAERLIKNGYDVLGLARNIKDVPFECMACDVSCYENIEVVALKLKNENRKIEGLINAAGISYTGLAIGTPKKISEDIINTNLLGTIYCSQLFSRFMLLNRYGTIINFSSIAVPLSIKGKSLYISSKSGVEAFTRVFAKELSKANINVNCISPGPIDTDALKSTPSIQINEVISQQAINRQFTKDDICDIVELLLDKRSRSLTGHIFNIGGI
jgi:3-oxoacyl-[acyl-carrier protein] reductase